MENIFESLIKATPVIKQIIEEDCAIVIKDNEKFLFVEEGKNIKLPIKAGMPAMDTPATEKVKSTKNPDYTVWFVKEYGTYAKHSTVPIFDENRDIIGMYSFIRDATEEEKNKVTSEELINEISDVETAIKIISESAEEISKKLNEIIKISSKSYEDIEKSNEALKLIDTTTRKTNILGINANIESARAGELGRGFSVVAKEMMKLASQSGTMSKEIEDSLMRMKSNVEATLDAMNKFQEIVEAQEESTKDIAIAMEKISNISKMLIK